MQTTCIAIWHLTFVDLTFDICICGVDIYWIWHLWIWHLWISRLDLTFAFVDLTFIGFDICGFGICIWHLWIWHLHLWIWHLTFIGFGIWISERENAEKYHCFIRTETFIADWLYISAAPLFAQIRKQHFPTFYLPTIHVFNVVMVMVMPIDWFKTVCVWNVAS